MSQLHVIVDIQRKAKIGQRQPAERVADFNIAHASEFTRPDSDIALIVNNWLMNESISDMQITLTKLPTE